MQLTNLLTTLLLTISLTLLPLTLATPGSPTPPISIASSLLPAATAAYNSALSSYAHTKTGAPEWSSAMNELYFYQLTGKNVPDFTATAWDSDVTTAAWYKAMPTDLKKYSDQEEKEQAELWTSVVKKVTSGTAARPANAGICVGSALALLVAGVAMVL